MTKSNDAAPEPDQDSVVHVARLFDVVGREAETLRRLEGSVAQLHRVQQAKAALKTLTAAELRAAAWYRRAARRGGTA